jgi:predicted nucleic acid-binding protein
MRNSPPGCLAMGVTVSAALPGALNRRSGPWEVISAQALAEGLTIATRDKRFSDYSAALLPA